MVVLHGRGAELASLDEAIASARSGRGRALCFTGEAGIGKSSLLAAARERAGELVVCAGSAWESGGAPPYWPWISVLRDAESRFGARVHELARAAHVDELMAGVAPGAPAADPAAARFALLDGVVRVLIELSREQPLLVLLDDLHAADVPSLELLVLAVRELPRASVALVAAWREGELAVRADAAQRLARAARHAIVQPLRRLTAAEVTAWVGPDGAAVHASTEGNPLFVEETLRAHRAGTPAPAIASVIEDHLALVSAATRELLAAGAVLGREIDPALLAAVADRDLDTVAAALREATAAGIVDARDDRPAFRHVLLRDHLYAALAPSRRAELHQRAGNALAYRDAGSAAAAHHLLRGTDPPRATAAARAAADRATSVFAFEDAVALLEAAVAAVAPGTHDALDLRIALAEARHRAGQGDLARAECAQAAELARALGDTAALARTALVYATELLTGRRDPVMLALLRDALAAQPEGDSPIRARLLARLAAAEVPSPDGNDAAALARAHDAVAMARRVGDPETELYAVRFASHAQGFRIPVREHLPATLAVVELSDRMGRPLEALEPRSWLVSAHLALGDRAASDRARAELTELLSRVSQPHYRWRLSILDATRAVLRGDLAAAQRHAAIVRVLAEDHAIDRARMCWYFCAVSIAAAGDDRDYAREVAEELRTPARLGMPLATEILGFGLAVAGQLDEARDLVQRTRLVPGIILSQVAAEAIVRAGVRERAQEALDALLPVPALYPLAVGPSGSLVLRPVAHTIGALHALLGRPEEARHWLEQALSLARRIDATPFIGDAEAALAALDGGARRAPAPSPARGELAIRAGGDLAHVAWAGRTITVQATKGMEYLAALVAAPGREIHVSDLVADEDRGDAGEVLDDHARADYRERARTLQRDLDDARARNDLGRIERLSAELDAIADQLISATGLGGRARRAGSRIERARVNVQRRIRDAIRRIAAEDAALGRYLDATIRTGTFCVYEPV